MRVAAPDARQRYRADFDAACEGGYVDPRLVAEGKCPAWLRYLRMAELSERPQEEWELEKVVYVWSGYRPHQAEAVHRLATERHVVVRWDRRAGKTLMLARALFDAARFTPNAQFVYVGASRATNRIAFNYVAGWVHAEAGGVISGTQQRITLHNEAAIGFFAGALRGVGDWVRGYQFHGVAVDDVELLPWAAEALRQASFQHDAWTLEAAPNAMRQERLGPPTFMDAFERMESEVLDPLLARTVEALAQEHPPTCEVDGCGSWAEIADDNGHRFCDRHWLMRAYGAPPAEPD